MEKGNLYKILGIVVLVVGFLGAILLAAVLGTGVYYRNWAVTISVFLCGAVSSILTAALLWYMGSRWKECSFCCTGFAKKKQRQRIQRKPSS